MINEFTPVTLAAGTPVIALLGEGAGRQAVKPDGREPGGVGSVAADADAAGSRGEGRRVYDKRELLFAG